MLEEDEATIQRIVNIAGKHTPEYNIDEIYEDLCTTDKE